MFEIKTVVVVLLTSAALSACDGGNGAAGLGLCRTIPGGVVTSSGPVTAAPSAGDGNLDSFATLSPAATASTASVKVSGSMVFPAGSKPGAFVTFLKQGSANSTVVRTYLAGTLAEQSSPTQLSAQPTNGKTAASQYLSITAAQKYDAVEFSETDSGGSSSATEYRVYEVCGDGNT